MNLQRLEQLENFLKKDPDDPFILYALAMEWLEENAAKSKVYFDQLLKDHKEYIGTYYQAAKLYSEIGKKEKAEDIYKKGIILAERLQDQHTLRELKSAYNEFLFNDEDI